MSTKNYKEICLTIKKNGTIICPISPACLQEIGMDADQIFIEDRIYSKKRQLIDRGLTPRYLYVGWAEYLELVKLKDVRCDFSCAKGKLLMWQDMEIIRVEAASHLNIATDY